MKTTSSTKVIAKKSLGQHFLKNKAFLNKIIRFSIDSYTKNKENIDNIVEIGPGTGLLTQELIQFTNENTNLHCIEKDTSLFNLLSEKYNNNPHIKLFNADALEFDYSEYEESNNILVANLPYNVSVPIIINYLKNIKTFKRYCILIQKEVALRLAAKPNTKDYGRISVLTQLYCNTKICFDIPGTAFTPTTKVTSSFIILTPKAEQPKIDFNIAETMLAKIFSNRRKMIRRVLVNEPALLKEILDAGIPETARAENIPVETFLKIFENLSR